MTTRELPWNRRPAKVTSGYPTIRTLSRQYVFRWERYHGFSPLRVTALARWACLVRDIKREDRLVGGRR